MKKTNVRWRIAVMLWGAVAINFIDRAVLSATTPAIMKEFNLDTSQMGIILSAFFWSYAICQVPSGWFADKVGQRISLTLSVGWWSIATALVALSSGLKSLVFFRVLLGIGESGCYPGSTGVASKWFPDKERARATSIFDSGSAIGASIAMPVITALTVAFGWRVPFIVAGAIGVVWAIGWWVYYHDPDKHKYINQAELEYIREGQAKNKLKQDTSSVKWYELLKHRNVWAMCFGFFTINYALYFFLTWFPTYLVEERGFELMEMGWASMLPPLAGFFGALLGGQLQDFLYKKGFSLTVVRKINLVGGPLVGTLIPVAGYVDSAVLSVIIMAVAYAGLSSASVAIWSVPGDIAPNNMTSVLAGLQNTFSNMGGVLGPIITGFIIANTGSFLPALIASGAATLIGACIYLFGLGKITPLQFNTANNTENAG